MKFSPRPYQSLMLDFADKVPMCGLWADMGLGKSVVAATVIQKNLEDVIDVGRWLIVAPKLVAEDTWPREFNKWDHLTSVEYRHLGSEHFGLTMSPDRKLEFKDKKKTKAGLLALQEPVHIVSWDFLPWLVRAIGEKDWPYDCIVLDEATFAQDQGSLRHKALWHVRDKARRMIELTGSPTPNGYSQLYGQIRILDGGKRLGRTLTSFRDQFMIPDKRNWHTGQVYSWQLKPGAKEQIDQKLSEICISMATADWLDLPDMVVNDIMITLPDSARAFYDELEAEMIADGVIASSAGVLFGKLMQAASGRVYAREDHVKRLHDVKLDRLGEIIESADGPILLAYNYVPEWEAICQRFKFAEHVKDKGILDRFRAGKVRLMGMHPASGAHGLDGLQNVCSTAVWFGATVNLEHWLQFNKRIHRNGTNADKVLVHRLLAADTLEEEVAKVRLEEKADEQAALLEAVEGRKNKWALSNQ
jgi:hypothetical protein